MEASTEWPPLRIPNAKRPWKGVYDTLTCLKNYLLFSLCILACSPLSPCVLPFVPASDLSFEPLFVVCTFFFELFCTQCFTFSFPVVLFPLPVVLVAFLSYLFSSCHSLFLPIVFFHPVPTLLYFFPLSRILFPQCFSNLQNQMT